MAVSKIGLSPFLKLAPVCFFSFGPVLLSLRRKGNRASAILPPLLVFAAFVAFQWISRLTASPFATRTQLQLLLADIVLIFLAAQAFRTLQDWRGFFWFVMLFAFLVSGFGILQHLTFNGKLYWFREMRYGGIPFGPYVNRNHFAGFAELAIPISLVPLMLGKVRRERRFIISFFALLPIGALFLCASAAELSPSASN